MDIEQDFNQEDLSTQIEKLALAVCKLKDQETELELELKEVKKSIYNSEKELGELLASQGFAIGSQIKLKNGRVLKIKDFFACSIPSQSAIESAAKKDPVIAEELSDRKQECLKWLDDNQLGGVIKNEIAVSLDRGENEKAKELMIELEQKGFNFVKEENVHPMTLKSTLKEAMSNGLNVPFDIFSVQTGSVVEIK